MMKKNKNTKKSFVLVAVLSVLSGLTIISVELSFEASEQVRHIQNLKDELQSQLIADAALEIVLNILEDDLRRDPSKDNYSENLMEKDEMWSKLYVLTPIDILYGKVWINVNDEMGKLNVNSLVDSTGSSANRGSVISVLEEFFSKVMNMPIDSLGLLQGYLDYDTEGVGEDISFTLGGFTARNYFISFPEEFFSLFKEGLDEEIFNKLHSRTFQDGRPDVFSSPYLTFWPKGAPLKLNINTATAEVLASLRSISTKIDEAFIKDLIKVRKEKPFKSSFDISNFLSVNGFTPAEIDLLFRHQLFDTKSDIFSVEIQVEINRIRSGIQSVIKRDLPSKIIFFRRV